MRRAPLAALAVATWALLGAPAALGAARPPELPERTYRTTSREILIPMDDGIRLAATVTFPSDDGASPARGASRSCSR